MRKEGNGVLFRLAVKGEYVDFSDPEYMRGIFEPHIIAEMRDMPILNLRSDRPLFTGITLGDGRKAIDVYPVQLESAFARALGLEHVDLRELEARIKIAISDHQEELRDGKIHEFSLEGAIKEQEALNDGPSSTK